MELGCSLLGGISLFFRVGAFHKKRGRNFSLFPCLPESQIQYSHHTFQICAIHDIQSSLADNIPQFLLQPR